MRLRETESNLLWFNEEFQRELNPTNPISRGGVDGREPHAQSTAIFNDLAFLSGKKFRKNFRKDAKIDDFIG